MTTVRRSFVTHTVTLLAGVVTALATVYFTQLARTSQQVDVGIVSAVESLPQPEPVMVTPQELLMLDISTTDEFPSLESLHMPASLNFLDVVQGGVDLDDFFTVPRVVNEMQRSEARQPVPVSLLEPVLEAIDNSPSPTFTTSVASDHAERVANLPVDSPQEFKTALDQLLEDNMLLRVSVQVLHGDEMAELDALIGTTDVGAPSDDSNTQNATMEKLNAIKASILDTASQADTVEGLSQHQLVTNRDRIARLVRDSVSAAASMNRLEIRTVVSNSGQTPVTVNRYGVLDVGSQDLLLPLEMLDTSGNLLILPGDAAEVVFATPEAGNDSTFWSDLMQHRNNGSNAVCRILLQPEGTPILSEAVTLSGISQERRNVFNQLLGTDESFPLDVESQYR